MAYRSKSPARALDELRSISARHPGLPIFAVDNILDRRYFTDFLPLLAASPVRNRLFYEVKADLTKDELRLLKAAGVIEIQPGIESLQDSVLRLMRKGVTALGNVQLLKWCAELGIRPSWNLLWGFPGEQPDAYREMADLVPLLTHLPPPVEGAPIRLDRFSPHFDRAAEFGFEDVRPARAYHHVYPFPPEVLSDLAYFFDFDYAGGSPERAYAMPLLAALEDWRNSLDSALCFSDDGTSLLMWDLRPGASALTITLSGLERSLYLACDACRSRRELVELGCREWAAAEGRVAEALSWLVDHRLSITDGRRYLSLAIPLGEYRLPRDALARLGSQLFTTTLEPLAPLAPLVAPPEPVGRPTPA
jgi:ribosomal peptide maturation radical SAM protein 1